MSAEKARLGAEEYAELVGRVQAALSEALPEGARTLVISRGDGELLDVPGLLAAHFPQDASGAYAGHHPRDSRDAVAHLEDLCAGGAEYLAIPDTARWWLDHYDGLAEHLSSQAEVCFDRPGCCMIFRLSRCAAQTGCDAQAPPSDPFVLQMRDYLEHLITADARLAVLEPSPGALAQSLSPLRAEGVSGERLERRRPAALGADYLVVPRAADDWLACRPEVQAAVESDCRKIADQRYVCRVFELAGREQA